MPMPRLSQGLELADFLVDEAEFAQSEGQGSLEVCSYHLSTNEPQLPSL